MSLISTRNASDGRIAGKVRQALADHSSHRQSVHDGTFCTRDAWFRFDAGILADTVEATQFAGTVSVHLALRLHLDRF